MKTTFTALLLSLASLAAPTAAYAMTCQEGVFCDRSGANCRAIAICCDAKGNCRVFWAQN